MSTVQQNLASIHAQIANAAKQCDRSPEEITLLAVSKTKPVTDIMEAVAAGQYCFGENYVQEGVDKIRYFMTQPMAEKLSWHFIGTLQSNKSRLVAEYFDWIHTIDRIEIAQRLDKQRPANLLPLNVLIQINISQEESKSGIMKQDLLLLAQQISLLPRLCLRGIMIIPAVEHDKDKQLAVFRQATALFQQLKQRYTTTVDTLSMGMSNDMEMAIHAGSTLVRIGTAIFGSRRD